MQNVHRVVAFLIVLIGCSVPTTGASAQQVGRLGNLNATGVPYHVYAEAGDPTIRVYVVGGGAAGVYDIGVGTRLDEFLALAAAVPGATAGNVRQRVNIQLYRIDEAGQRRLVLEGQAEELLRANPDTYPRLRDGDFIAVEVRTRQRFGWRDGLQILTGIGSIIVLVERLSRAF